MGTHYSSENRPEEFSQKIGSSKQDLQKMFYDFEMSTKRNLISTPADEAPHISHSLFFIKIISEPYYLGLSRFARTADYTNSTLGVEMQLYTAVEIIKKTVFLTSTQKAAI